VQEGSSHWPARQYPVTQWASSLHDSPKQRGQVPPQSIPVSPGSCWLFWQAGSTQVPRAPQAPERQSEPSPHAAPSSQLEVAAQLAAAHWGDAPTSWQLVPPIHEVSTTQRDPSQRWIAAPEQRR
jgi:hypothetical protein